MRVEAKLRKAVREAEHHRPGLATAISRHQHGGASFAEVLWKFAVDPRRIAKAGSLSPSYCRREVQKLPPLSREEEVLCVQHVRAKDEQAEYAGKDLMCANPGAVVSIAERYRDDRIHILDLFQRGNEGLLEPLKAFADSHEESFPAHAIPYIERAIAQIAAK